MGIKENSDKLCEAKSLHKIGKGVDNLMCKKLYCIIMALCMTFCTSSCSDNAVIEPEQTVPKADAVSEKLKILSFDKSLLTHYEGIDDYYIMTVLSENSYVTLDEKDAEKFPEMAKVFNELAPMVKRSMEDEVDNLISFANEEIKGGADGFETYISKMDAQIRRADSVAVSVLSDSYADHGMIEDFRGMHGTNYDTGTGKELKLSEVIKDMSRVPEIVTAELNTHIWAGEGYPDTVIYDYFTNTPEDGISWTLDYNGVTFYFGDGAITEPGNGGQTATISFAEHPELFVEKYMTSPEAYIVRLPLDNSFFTDLDGNGDLEELHFTGFYNKTDRFYSQFGFYTDTNGYFHYEDCFAYDYIPYYIKAADGNHYLYLFCEESETLDRQMLLYVYKLNNGKFTKIGEMNAGPHYTEQSKPTDGVFAVLTDPEEFYLVERETVASEKTAYTVGNDGMPIRKQ